MNSYSVIVTVHNMAKVIGRTLHSVETAIEVFRQQESEAASGRGEIIVVDDGSTDGSRDVIEEHAAGKDLYRLVHHRVATSPSCARNVGVNASSGALLFFLDGDDLFYPDHIQVCQRELKNQHVCFVKTGVHLADPVHQDWQERINHSLVLNLCVRRACHDAVGGFLDYHLFRRKGADLKGEIDIFYKFEDMYYNELIARLFPGVGVRQETVEYIRYPGNSFDRQYGKFLLPFDSYSETRSDEEHFQLALCDVIFQHRLQKLQETARQAPRELWPTPA